MPTYEYACKDCGQHIEVVQSFRDDPLQTCSSCQGRLRKVFSAAGIIFKGSGYYVTDTRKASSSDSTSGSSESGTSESGTSESGTSGGDSSGSDKGSSDTSSTSDSSSASSTSDAKSA